MKINKRTITEYYLEGEYKGFIVEALDYGKWTEFWLCHTDYGVKHLMFGTVNEDIKHKCQIQHVIMPEIDCYISFYEREVMQ